MKALITILSLFFYSGSLVAQTNFEGLITYTYPAFMDSNADTLMVYFGKNKIRIDNNIYDFKSGYMYTLYPGDSDFIKVPITDLISRRTTERTLFAGISKKIAGYNCSAYEERYIGGKAIKDSLKRLWWYIDSPYYFIPKKFRNCAQLTDFVNNNRIGAGTTVSSTDGAFSFMVEASIFRQQLPDSIFELPKTYPMEIRNIPGNSLKNKRKKKNRIILGSSMNVISYSTDSSIKKSQGR